MAKMETWHCESGECNLGKDCPFFNDSTEYCWVERRLEQTDILREIIPTAFELSYRLEDLQIERLAETIDNLKMLRCHSLDFDTGILHLYQDTYKAKTGKEW